MWYSRRCRENTRHVELNSINTTTGYFLTSPQCPHDTQHEWHGHTILVCYIISSCPIIVFLALSLDAAQSRTSNPDAALESFHGLGQSA